jgi:hypothetical protein
MPVKKLYGFMHARTLKQKADPKRRGLQPENRCARFPQQVQGFEKIGIPLRYSSAN